MLIKLRPNLDLSMASYFSLKPFTIFFFIFINITTFFLSSHCHGADNFSKCSIPYDCGDFKNVNFPFWGGSRPQFCGLQGFDLVCREKRSFIHINKLDYQILKLNHFNDENKMTIAMANSCSPPESPETTLDFHVFKSDPKEFSNLNLIYDCSVPLLPSVSPLKYFSCPHDEVVHCADDNQMEKLRPHLNQTCRTVQIPVSRVTLDKITRGFVKVEEALREGFEVEYHAPGMELCGACLESGGSCGCNNTQTNSFVCYRSSDSKFLLFLFPSFFLQSQYYTHLKDKGTLFLNGIIILLHGLAAGCILQVF